MFIAFKKSGKNTLAIHINGRKSVGKVVKRSEYFFAELSRRVTPAEREAVGVFTAVHSGMSLAR